MSHCEANKNIRCTVQQCAHHCKDQQYCSLKEIVVGAHELNPSMVECTDCQSFALK